MIQLGNQLRKILSIRIDFLAESQFQEETDSADSEVHIDEENDQNEEAQDFIIISAKKDSTAT